MRSCLRLSAGHHQKLQTASENFNGECVDALVNKFLQRIIHKAMLRHAALAGAGLPRYDQKLQVVTPIPRRVSLFALNSL